MKLKLSLCMICKPDDREAELLDRCLSYVAPHVDEICITITGHNANCDKVARKYKATVSQIPWNNDFAEARNFNFNEAKGDYILWLDCDDVLRGAENLPKLVKYLDKNKIDTVIMNYLYDFDKSGLCTVKHLKTRIVKRGTVEWVGKLHEDFRELKVLDSYFCEDIEVLHLIDKDRERASTQRNIDIAEKAKAEAPEDPRSYWLTGQSYMGAGMLKEAKKEYRKFLQLSQSEEEKYLAYLALGEITGAKTYFLQAIWLRPIYPDAYHRLARLADKEKRYTTALQLSEIGLQLPIPKFDIIVYNPREYDYNPMSLMMSIYFKTGKYEKAIKILDTMIEMYPKDEKLLMRRTYIKQELQEALDADKYLTKAQKLKGEKLRKYLDNLPDKARQHPKICLFYNSNFAKTKSSGKDLTYYCSYTSKEWNPNTAEKGGVGGSEEAVINLTRELAKQGWNITVYNNCGTEGEWNGVKYRHYWKYNIRDKTDVTIFWRHPKPVDFNPNSTHILIDLHDVIGKAEFTPDRLAKIDKIMVKSKAQRDLYPDVPDDKFAVISNGINLDYLENDVSRDPYLILNTSSPDRHLEATLRIFKKLPKKYRLAWYYGWGVYDGVHAENKKMKDWKAKMVAEFEELKVQGRAEGGTMVSHREIGELYQKAGVLLYPTQFYEINCISVLKAQAAGCIPITSDFAALNETNIHGAKVHTNAEKWEHDSTFGDSEDNDEAYIKLIEASHTLDSVRQHEMQTDVKNNYQWPIIANQWNKELEKL